MTSRYEQAVRGVTISGGNNVVLVDDGHCRWLCAAGAWVAVQEGMEAQAALADDEGGGEAYGQLCTAVGRRSAIASSDGSSTVGTTEARRALMDAAMTAGLDVAGIEDDC